MEESKRNGCPVPKGKLLVIGGAENKGEKEPDKKEKPSDFETLEVLKTLIKLTNKKHPAIEIVTSASSEWKESFNEYKEAFKKLGVNDPGHIHHESHKDLLTEDDELVARVKKADAIFFTGGDQLKYSAIYGGTKFLTHLKERYIHEKFVVAGTSAGAMVLSTPMIYAGNDEVSELGGMIKVTTGLEFIKDVCIDTHFVHRGRFLRMAQVIATNPTCIGFGIEEDTAIVIANGVDVEVVGTGTVIVMEGFDITDVNIEDFTRKKPITVRDLRIHILSDKEKYKIRQMNPPHV
jgi:cyanophycinase